MKKCSNKGFTLVEMLVVMGIIGLLIAMMTGAFKFVQNTAWQSRSQELVTNVSTALTMYISREGVWPGAILNSGGVVNNKVCAVLQHAKLLDVTTATKIEFNPDGTMNITLNPNSPERFGLLSPWGQRLVKRITGDSLPEDLERHMLMFCVDENLDGKIDSSEAPPNGIPGQDKEKGVIRASAIVWSCGPNGKAAGEPGAKKPGENRQSWVGGGK